MKRSWGATEAKEGVEFGLKSKKAAVYEGLRRISWIVAKTARSRVLEAKSEEKVPWGEKENLETQRARSPRRLLGRGFCGGFEA
jgi:hypothetical protein